MKAKYIGKQKIGKERYIIYKSLFGKKQDAVLLLKIPGPWEESEKNSSCIGDNATSMIALNNKIE